MPCLDSGVGQAGGATRPRLDSEWGGRAEPRRPCSGALESGAAGSSLLLVAAQAPLPWARSRELIASDSVLTAARLQSPQVTPWLLSLASIPGQRLFLRVCTILPVLALVINTWLPQGQEGLQDRRAASFPLCRLRALVRSPHRRSFRRSPWLEPIPPSSPRPGSLRSLCPGPADHAGCPWLHPLLPSLWPARS